MGVEWNSDAALDVAGLLKSWKRSHDFYGKQIIECQMRGTPCDQMKGCQTQLWECIHNLERATGVTKADEFKKNA